MNVSERFKELGIVPVVVIDNIEDVRPLAKALINGGLPVAEVTFRTAAAKSAIKIMASEFPEMLVGAGTVITMEQLKSALEAGAKFIVSPGYDDEIVDYCLSHDVPVFPGTVTPSEIIKAYKKGLKTVKFFPAEQYGGLKTIKALAGPFTTMTFMPTGGINAGNVKEYLSYEKIVAVGGSWMVKAADIKEKKFDVIEEKVREAVALVKEIR